MSYRAKPKAKSSVSRGSALMFSGVYCKDIVVRSSTMLPLFINAHGVPPQRRYPDRPPRRVQKSTRNEICLAANEILLRKVKYVCDG